MITEFIIGKYYYLEGYISNKDFSMFENKKPVKCIRCKYNGNNVHNVLFEGQLGPFEDGEGTWKFVQTNLKSNGFEFFEYKKTEYVQGEMEL